MHRIVHLLIFFHVFLLPSMAQVQIGPKKTMLPFLSAKWEDGQLEALKKSTTLMLVPSYSEEDMEYLRRELKAHWDLSTLVVCSMDEMEECQEELEGEPLSFLRFMFERVTMDGNPHTVYYYLQLIIPQGRDKNGKPLEDHFARIALDPSLELYKRGIDLKEGGDPWASFDAYSSITNLQPAMIVNYLKYIRSVITSKEVRNMYTEENKREELSKLKDNKLYVLDNVLYKMDLGKRTSTPVDDPHKLFDDYPYHYAFISAAELNSKLREGDEQFYYLVMVRSGLHKWIAVYESATGDMIYSYSPGSMIGYPNLTRKDVEELEKSIR